MKNSLRILLTILVLPLLLFACGQSQPGSAQPTKDLLAVTPLTTHVFKQPTTIIKEAAAEKVETPEAAADLSRGERSYTSKKCGDCHGAKGEGVEGKGKALAGTTMTEEEFTDILRTGGGLGNSHIYGPQAISPSGMEALYAFVKSFQP